MNGDAFHRLCLSRRSTREFLPDPLEAGEVAHLLECARSIPYASSRRGWDVLMVADRAAIERAALAVDEVAREWSTKVRADLREEWGSYSRNFSAFRNAPAVFLPVFRPSPSLAAMLEDPDPWAESFDRENHLKSIANATMALCLAATSLGLAACPMTGPLLARSELESIFSVPRGRELAGLVAIGRPLTSPIPSGAP